MTETNNNFFFNLTCITIVIYRFIGINAIILISIKNVLLIKMASRALYLLVTISSHYFSVVVHQSATDLHADATFKVVLSIPHCRSTL